MLRVILLIATCSITSLVQSQKSTSIELDFLVRYDKHADFTTRFFDRTYTNQTKLWGLSYGSNLSLLHPLTNGLKFKVGVGYYRIAIDKVRQSTRVNTFSPARTIDYNHPLGIEPLFASSYYHYNTIALTGGLTHEGKIQRHWNYNVGGDFTYLYTFSQRYNIDYGNLKYRTKNGRALGLGVNIYLGTITRIHDDKYYFNPTLIIPIYQELRGDHVFGEDKHLKMNKWFNGVGLGLTVGKYL